MVVAVATEAVAVATKPVSIATQAVALATVPRHLSVIKTAIHGLTIIATSPRARKFAWKARQDVNP